MVCTLTFSVCSDHPPPPTINQNIRNSSFVLPASPLPPPPSPARAPSALGLLILAKISHDREPKLLHADNVQVAGALRLIEEAKLARERVRAQEGANPSALAGSPTRQGTTSVPLSVSNYNDAVSAPAPAPGAAQPPTTAPGNVVSSVPASVDLMQIDEAAPRAMKEHCTPPAQAPEPAEPTSTEATDAGTPGAPVAAPAPASASTINSPIEAGIVEVSSATSPGSGEETAISGAAGGMTGGHTSQAVATAVGGTPTAPAADNTPVASTNISAVADVAGNAGSAAIGSALGSSPGAGGPDANPIAQVQLLLFSFSIIVNRLHTWRRHTCATYTKHFRRYTEA